MVWFIVYRLNIREFACFNPCFNPHLRHPCQCYLCPFWLGLWPAVKLESRHDFVPRRTRAVACTSSTTTIQKSRSVLAVARTMFCVRPWVSISTRNAGRFIQATAARCFHNKTSFVCLSVLFLRPFFVSKVCVGFCELNAHAHTYFRHEERMSSHAEPDVSERAGVCKHAHTPQRAHTHTQRARTHMFLYL